MKITRRERARRIPVTAVLGAVATMGAVAALPATVAGASGNQVKVSAQTIGKMGKVLVSGGKALYVISVPAAACNSSCLTIWPALTVPAGGKASAGSGISKSKLGTTKDALGARQVTYGGKAVYWFSGDSKGTVNGNITDEWGKWTAVVVVKPKNASGAGTTTTTSNSSAGGGGVSF